MLRTVLRAREQVSANRKPIVKCQTAVVLANQRNEYHTSTLNQRMSRYKFIFAPHLRRNRPTPADREKDPVTWKQNMVQNSEWHRKLPVRFLVKRQQKILNTGSYRLPQGGFRIGILEIIAEKATNPNHLQLVHQCISIVIHKQPRNIITAGFAGVFCRSAARMNVPQMGLAFVQSPWLKVFPKQAAIRNLLECYAKLARDAFLNRIAVGLEPVVPEFYTLKPRRKEGEEEEEEEDEAAKQQREEKEKSKKLQHFLTEFVATYKELLSDRHAWKAGGYSLSAVASVYACLGDVDTAKSIIATIPPDHLVGTARDDLALALLFSKRTSEVPEILNYYKDHKTPNPLFEKRKSKDAGRLAKYNPFQNLIPLRGQIAYYLAQNDSENLKKIISEFQFINSEIHPSKINMFSQELTRESVQVHFGIPSRIQLLKDVVESIVAEQQGQQITDEKIRVLPDDFVEYVRSIGSEPAEGEEGAGEGEEAEQ